MKIYDNTENFPYDSLQNKDFLNKIRTSPEHSIYPITKMNLDSLESVLSTRKQAITKEFIIIKIISK